MNTKTKKQAWGNHAGPCVLNGDKKCAVRGGDCRTKSHHEPELAIEVPEIQDETTAWGAHYKKL